MLKNIKITKTCYMILYLGMGDICITPNLVQKGKVFTNIPVGEDEVSTEEIKKELQDHNVGTDFMADTNYKYVNIGIQPPHSVMIPVECFEFI